MNQRTNLKTILLLTALSMILLIATGCDDTTTGIKINPDGSCVRTIRVKGESKEFLKGPYPCPGPKNEGWKIERKWEIKDDCGYEEEEGKKNTTANHKKYVYTAEKNFSRVSDLNAEFNEGPKVGMHPSPVKIDYRLDKRFAWFFTYYTYRETYREYIPFKRVPLSKFFDAKELEILKLAFRDKEESEKKYPESTFEELDKKFEKWYYHAAFEEFFHELLVGLGKTENPRLEGVSARAVSQKDALYDEVIESSDVTEMMKKTSEFFQVPELMDVFEQHKKAFEELDMKYRAVEALIGDQYTNNVTMPGLITDTDAETVSGNTVTWEFDVQAFFISDYEMVVESRMVNWWAVGIAGFIVLLGFIIIIAGTVRRSKAK